MRSDKDIELFIDTAFSAYAAAAQRAANRRDDGTCNFDVAVLYIKHGSAKAVEMLKRIGLPAYLRKRGVVVVSTPFGGQAQKRTSAVEAIYETFEQAKIPGVVADIEYQMD